MTGIKISSFTSGCLFGQDSGPPARLVTAKHRVRDGWWLRTFNLTTSGIIYFKIFSFIILKFTLIIRDAAAINCIHDTLWAAFLVLSHIPGVPGEWAIESHISRCRPLFTILPHFIQTGVQSHRRLTASAFQLDFTAEERNWSETEKWRKPKLTFSTEWEMGNRRMNGESRLRCWAANKYILSRLCYIRAEVLWFISST